MRGGGRSWAHGGANLGTRSPGRGWGGGAGGRGCRVAGVGVGGSSGGPYPAGVISRLWRR